VTVVVPWAYDIKAKVPSECDGSHITFVLKGCLNFDVDLCQANSGATTISVLGDDEDQNVEIYNGPGLIGDVALHGGDDDLSIYDSFSGGNIFMGAGDDSLYVSNSYLNHANMKAGDDYVLVWFGAVEAIKFGDGDDVFNQYYVSANLLDFGAGDDSAQQIGSISPLEFNGVVTLNFGSGDDYASLTNDFSCTTYSLLQVNFGEGSDFGVIDYPVDYSETGGCMSVDFGSNGQEDKLYIELYEQNPSAYFCNLGCSQIVPGAGPCFEISYNATDIQSYWD